MGLGEPVAAGTPLSCPGHPAAGHGHGGPAAASTWLSSPPFPQQMDSGGEKHSHCPEPPFFSDPAAPAGGEAGGAKEGCARAGQDGCGSVPSS